MPPFDIAPPTNRYLAFAKRIQIEYLLSQNVAVRQIARVLGSDPSTVSREIRRNAATRSTASGYRANVAQWKAERATKRPKVAKLVANPRLHDYVQERLAGGVRDKNGAVIHVPPSPRFTGNNKPFRKDRAWVWA